jgi:hypothetical protein
VAGLFDFADHAFGLALALKTQFHSALLVARS